MIEDLRKFLKDYEIDGIIIKDLFEIIETLCIKRSYNFFEITPILLITEKKIYLFLDRFSYEEMKEVKDVEMVVIEKAKIDLKIR